MVCFISLFALDVFEDGKTAWAIALALIIHLLPSIAAIIIIIVAWKREQIGGWLFVALGFGLLFIGQFQLATILIIILPTVVIGVMFLAHYHKYMKVTKGSSAPSAG